MKKFAQLLVTFALLGLSGLFGWHALTAGWGWVVPCLICACGACAEAAEVGK